MAAKPKRTARKNPTSPRRSTGKSKSGTPSRRAAAAADKLGSRAGDAAASAYKGALDAGQEQLSRAAMAALPGNRIGGNGSGGDRLAGSSGPAAPAIGDADVLMRAGGTMAHAAEDLGKCWLELAQLSVRNGVTLARAFAEARSLQDVIDAQADMAEESIDRLVAESRRFSELSGAVASEAVLPLQGRFARALGLGAKSLDRQ